MKRYFLLAIGLLLAVMLQAENIRVMTYNVRHCEGLDGHLDIARTASVIEKAAPDFVAVQEIDSCTERTGRVDQLRELGIATLMHPTFAAAIPLQGGAYGVGLLSRERPISVRRIPLPNDSESRVLLVCEFRECVVACTHLSLNEADHAASADVIEQEAARWQKPFIIMGDWNSRPDSPFIARIKQHFSLLSNTKYATFPADEPKECIDYIAAYRPQGPAQAVRASFRVLKEPQASDHRPLLASLELKVPAARLMTMKPYLQDPRPDAMTVMFQTNAVCHAWVEYGTDSLNTQRARTMIDGQEVCYDIENAIHLTGLTPGQRYYYRVCLVGLTHKESYNTYFGDTLCTPFYSFRTPDPAASDFTAVIFNDLHENNQVYKALLKQLDGISPDFVVFNGDCLPEPSDREHAIEMIHNLADPINGAEVPVIFVRGNHEIRNFYSAGMHSLVGHFNDKTYGAFTWADTRFVILDLGEDKPDDTPVYADLNDFTSLRFDQKAFLQEEFRSKAFRKAGRRVLISHIPIFVNDDKYQPCVQLWGPLLAKQPFDIYLCAHVHKFKFFPNGVGHATFPIMRGGAPRKSESAVAILSKKGKNLHLRALCDDGTTHLDIDL